MYSLPTHKLRKNLSRLENRVAEQRRPRPKEVYSLYTTGLHIVWHAISGAKRTNELRSRVRTPTRPSNGRSRPSFSSLFFSAFRVFLYTTSSIAPLPRSVRQRVARFTPRLSHPEPQCCSAPLCIHTYATGALAFSFFFFSFFLSFSFFFFLRAFRRTRSR